MCRFTLQRYICGHYDLLTGPENTQLCTTALHCNFLQGKDNAPAPCHPLPSDIDSHTSLAAEHHLFTECDTCHSESRYTETDVEKVDTLQQQIQQLANEGLKIITSYSRLEFQMLPSTNHPWMQRYLQLSSMEKFKGLLMEELTAVRDWLGTLYTCVADDAPRQIFDYGLQVAKAKVGRAVEKLDAFEAVVILMDSVDMEKEGWERRMWVLVERMKGLYEGGVVEEMVMDGGDEKMSASSVAA